MDDNDYQPPFRFTGKMDKLTIKLEELNAAEERLLKEKAQLPGTRRNDQQ